MPPMTPPAAGSPAHLTAAFQASEMARQASERAALARAEVLRVLSIGLQGRAKTLPLEDPSYPHPMYVIPWASENGHTVGVCSVRGSVYRERVMT